LSALRRCAASAAASLPLLLFAYSGGPPARRTGAPGDLTCLDANCHAGERLEDSPAVSLETGTGGVYTPGGPRQRWTVRNSDPRARAYGLQLTVREAADSAARQAGALIATEADSIVICADQTAASPAGCPADRPLQFFSHTTPRRHGEFTLEWQPPSSDVGVVLAYVAFNASVTGQRNSRVHFRTFQITPGAAAVNAASFTPGFSSGGWVTIFGRQLGSSARSWTPSDVRDGRLPTSLDGTSVRINGRAAFLSYVSPGQLNALAPDDDATGTVTVEVERDHSLVTAFPARKDHLAPAFFGRGQSVQAGGRAELYGTGFGPTDPAVPAGLLFHPPLPLKGRLTVTVGGRNAAVEFAGLIGPGLFRILVAVPDLGPGVHEVFAEVDGVRTPPGFFLTVAS